MVFWWFTFELLAILSPDKENGFDQPDVLIVRAAQLTLQQFCFTDEYLRALKDLRVAAVILLYYPTKVTKTAHVEFIQMFNVATSVLQSY